MSNEFKRVDVGFKDSQGFEYLLPMKNEDGQGSGVFPIGALKIPSRHSREQVLGTLLRKLPIAEMHQPYFYRLMLMLAGKVPERGLYLESPPTTGKTTLGQVLAEAMGCDCAMINCGGVSLDELIQETYVNGKTGRDIFQQLTAKLAEGDISEFYLGQLEHALGKAFVHEEKIEGTLARSVVETLQNRFRRALHESEALGSGRKEYRIVWDNVPEREREADREFLEKQGISTKPSYHIALQQIEKEKLKETSDNINEIAGGMGIGKGSQAMGIALSTKNGRLLDTLITHINNQEPAVIVLDEFTRRRDDGGSMQQLYEVIAGRRQSCELAGGDGKTHRITRQAMEDAGIVVIINANPKTPDEMNVLPAPGAFLSRLGESVMSGYGQEGWQMRIEQYMADMPLTFIYDTWRPGKRDKQQEFDRNAADILGAVHKMGLPPQEQGNRPIYQNSFLRKHGDFSSGTQNVAKFCDIWRQVTNPESALYASAAAHGQYLENATDTLRALQREAQKIQLDTDHPAHNVRIDLRWIEKILMDSITTLPVPVPRDQAVGTRWRDGDDEPEAQFGTRLVSRLHREINKLYPDPDSKIRQFLELQMVRCGLCLGTDLSLSDQDIKNRGAKPGDVRVVASAEGTAKALLNIPRQRSISEEARHWQGLLVTDLVKKYPDLFDEAALQTPDRILPIGIVHDALVNLPQEMKETEYRLGDQKTVPLLSVNVTRQKKGIHLGHALLMAGVDEGFERPDAGRFLMTLAMPGATELLIDRLWQDAPGATGTLDEPSLICRNQSKSGLAVTTIQLDDHNKGGKKVPTYMHVLRFKSNLGERTKKDKFIMVGDLMLEPKLQQQLRDEGVIYISRKDPQANEKLQKNLDEFIHLAQEQVTRDGTASSIDWMQQLHRAFRYRNEPTESWKQARAAELKKPAGKLNEENDLFGSKTLKDLMLDDSLTRPHKDQVMVMAELSDEAIEDLRASQGAAAKNR